MTQFISRIYNYCDSWCERCEFTSHCSVADAEKNLSDEKRDINNKAFWANISANFAEAQRMLIKAADKFGIDFKEFDKKEYKAIRSREKNFIQNHYLTKLSLDYLKDSRKALENKQEFLLFALIEEDQKANFLEIIYWYQMFISAKIQRGLNGLLDFDGNFDEEESNDIQSDSNGSIKIALIAIQRSIMAWTILMSAENSHIIKPLISLLENIKQTAIKEFPNANDFIRPGFDEIETIM